MAENHQKPTKRICQRARKTGAFLCEFQTMQQWRFAARQNYLSPRERDKLIQ
jgi:hypothetical protein